MKITVKPVTNYLRRNSKKYELLVDWYVGHNFIGRYLETDPVPKDVKILKLWFIGWEGSVCIAYDSGGKIYCSEDIHYLVAECEVAAKQATEQLRQLKAILAGQP